MKSAHIGSQPGSGVAKIGRQLNTKRFWNKNKKDNSVDVLEWCTLDQAIHIYRSDVVGRALCDEAGKDLRTTRRHPLVPLLDEARQFKVPTPLDMKQIH